MTVHRRNPSAESWRAWWWRSWRGPFVRRDSAELEQFEPERLDLSQYAVQRGLVRNGASQEGVLALCLGSERGEGAQRCRAEVAANTELAPGRGPPPGTGSFPARGSSRCSTGRDA